MAGEKKNSMLHNIKKIVGIDEAEVNAKLLRQKIPIKNLEDAKYYLDRLQEFCDFDYRAQKLHGEKFQELIRSILSVGEDGVYSNELRFLFELIQNVDDCNYEDINKCYLDIYFDTRNDTITLQYNESGFTTENVYAISRIADTTKNQTDVDKTKKAIQIGEKGIGFKSVFGIAQKVKVESGYFSFSFDTDKMTIPNPEYSNGFKGIKGTKITLFLRSGEALKVYNKILEQYKNWTSTIKTNPILFLNKLSKVTYRCDNDNYIEFAISKRHPYGEGDFFEESNLVLTYEKSIDGKKDAKKLECFRYTQEITYGPEECFSRYKNTNIKEKNHNIIVVIPKPGQGVSQGALYSFLPTRIETSVPMIFHVPFKLDVSREYVDSQGGASNEWYVYTIRAMRMFIKKVYDKLSKSVGEHILDYIPTARTNCIFVCGEKEKSRILESNAWCLNRLKHEEPTGTIMQTTISDYKIIPTSTGEYVTLSEVCCIEHKNFKDAADIYQYISESKKLFSGDYKNNIDKYGIYVVKSYYNELVKRLIEDEKSTENIIDILKNQNQEELSKEIKVEVSSTIMTLKQLKLIEVYPLLFKKICEANLLRFKSYGAPGIQIKCERIVNSSDLKNISTLKVFLNDFAKSLDKNFIRYMNSCSYIKIDSWDEGTFFLSKDILFYSNLLDDVSEIYKLIDNRSISNRFYALLQLESESQKLDNLIRKKPNLSEQEFLIELYNSNKVQQRKLGNYYKKILEFIDNSGTETTRFMNELLQNADDCLYSEDVIPEYRIDLKGKKVTVSYNEKGFSKENIRAITDIGESTKRMVMDGTTTIGEKGIGFKAVFKVCDSIKIHSGEFHFILRANAPTIPEIIDNVAFQPGTMMEFDLKEPLDKSIFESKSLLRLVLCLKKLRHLTINGKRLIIIDNENERIVSIDEDEYTYEKYNYYYLANKDALKHRRTINESIKDEQVITYLLPKKKDMECYLYNGLPTLIKMNIPLIVDAPLVLTTSREDIIDDIWNKDVCLNISNGFVKLIDSIKEKWRIKILSLVPSDGMIFKDRTLKKPQNYINLLNTKDFLPCFNHNTWLCPNKKQLFVTYDVERYVIKKYGISQANQHWSLDIIDCGEKSNYISKLKLFGIKQRTFEDTIKKLVYEYKIITADNLEQDKELWKLFYKLLTTEENNKKNAGALRLVPCVPIKISSENSKFVTYESQQHIFFSDDINDMSNESYAILDTTLMGKEEFNRIFDTYIDRFDEAKRQEMYGNMLRGWLDIPDKKNASQKFLKEFVTKKAMFLTAIRNYFYMDDIYRIPILLKDGTYDTTEYKFCSKQKFDSFACCTVSEEYEEFAKSLGIKDIEQIESAEEFPTSSIDEDMLLDMFKIPFEHANGLYKDLIEEGYIEENLFKSYFFEICDKASLQVGDLEGVYLSGVPIDSRKKNWQFISGISIMIPSIYFTIDFPMIEKKFDRDDIIDEVLADARYKTGDDSNFSTIEEWFYKDAIYYADVNEGIFVRLANQQCKLFLNINARLDNDILNTFKSLLKTYFGVKIDLERHMRSYTKQGVKLITSIPYTKENVLDVANHIQTFDNVEEEKDFLARPVFSRGKVFGGYAKRCPLCGARVHTELTGFRIQKLSQSGTVNNKEVRDEFHLICCQNCFDAFRYAEGYWINLEKWHRTGKIEMAVSLQGEIWTPNEFLPRLAHQALLYKMNKDNF